MSVYKGVNGVRSLLLCLFLFPCMLHSQLEKVIVETYYVSDGADSVHTDGGKLKQGSVTYRVFVDLKPGSKLLKIYGDTNHVLNFSSTEPFFNDSTTTAEAQTFGFRIPKAAYYDNKVALDTWITLGQTTRTAAGKTNFGILKRQDKDGSFVGGANNSNGDIINSGPEMGAALTTSDGMHALAVPSLTFDMIKDTYGINDPFTAVGSTIFGSFTGKKSFSSRKAFLKNGSGVEGPIPDSNQVLVAQLTTKGQLTFEMNLEVLQPVNGMLDTVRYVANDDTLVTAKKEKKSSYLKYPFPPPVCGCKDPAFLEYDANLECSDDKKFCLNRIVFGCTDSMACNFDPGANFPLNSLCCYPGSCNGRDISVVCPSVRGDAFEVDVFPNPATTSIFLNVTTGKSQEISYSVINYYGTEVLAEALGPELRIINHEIDLSGLSNGLYLVRVNVGSSYINKQFFKIEE